MQNRDAVIRQAHPNDLETLLQYEQGVVTAERPFAINFKDGPITYYDLPALMDSDAAHVVVADKHGELLGCGYLRVKVSEPHYKASQFGYLGFMFTVPEARGQGLNKEILDTLVTWGKKQGLSVFKLDVFEGNQSAIRAYEKAGFKPHLLEMVLELPA